MEPLPRMRLNGGLLGLLSPRPSIPRSCRGFEKLGRIVDEVEKRGEEARVGASK